MLNNNAIKIFRPFLTEINDDDVKIYIGLRLAKYVVKPFIYGTRSESAEQPVLIMNVSQLPVKLGKKDPNFGVTKERLKNNDYGWCSELSGSRLLKLKL